jgi:ATP-dependent DNA helicase RecG
VSWFKVLRPAILTFCHCQPITAKAITQRPCQTNIPRKNTDFLASRAFRQSLRAVVDSAIFVISMSGNTKPELTPEDRLRELQRPVQYLRGVGPQRAEILEKLGLSTAADVLFFFPRDYENFSQLQSISDVVEGVPVSVLGTIIDIQEWTSSRHTHVLAILIEQGNGGYLRGIWFNQHFLKKRFANGQLVMLQGTAAREDGRWQMSHPRVTWFQEGERPAARTILPVYPLTEGIGQRRIREIMERVVADFGPMVSEVLPQPFRSEKNLCDIQTAICQVHFPDSEASLERARFRFVYQELFVLQLALAMRRAHLRSTSDSPALLLDAKIRSRILRRFPFELSTDQNRAIDEIAADMARPVPMNRLLHGETGSGKTVVAAFAMLLAVAHGYQAVLMAPTELLARQHVRTLSQWLSGGRVRIAAWTGSLGAAEKAALSAEIADGRVQIVVGTHSLLSSPPEFSKPGIVVIDEQHKFGVRQRARLRETGNHPHYLVMTATPIPRTIAMTDFGDLDVSELRKPAGRDQPVHTYLGTEDKREKWWEFVRQKLREGRQAYVIAPLVKGDPDSALSSAESLLESLANGPLEAFRLDILHGRQKPGEKESVMLAFQRGTTQVLIATSIVEVGVDVPNASVLTIESAERFGLSQLHQIRGRVSRGDHPGYVCVFPSTDNVEALSRLQAFVDSRDGFELAELDFRLRGPGNLMGDRQHGLPPLRIADLVRDGELLQTAREDARRIIDLDPRLENPSFGDLKRMLIARYGKTLEISDVG